VGTTPDDSNVASAVAKALVTTRTHHGQPAGFFSHRPSLSGREISVEV
jgi:hypothetical protein